MKRSISSHSVKHVPQRTCVACGKVKAKQEMIRLVCVSDGSIEVDTSGRKMGRGAYLCRARGCWEIGLREGRLEYSLRATLTQDNRGKLIKFGGVFSEE